MAELSPAARAIRDAVLDTYAPSVPRDNNLWRLEQRSTVAALRAVADQVVNPDDYEPVCVFKKDYWDYGFSAAVDTIRGTLLAIAAELEGADG